MKTKLFALLNARYLLLDRRLTPAAGNPGSVTAGRHAVFQDPWVTVYESDDPTQAAWMVHDVATAPKEQVLAAMSAPSFNPGTMAVVEGAPIATEPPPAGTVERAKVTLYAPETIRIEATAASAGLLVISEPSEEGWRAYVDGKPAPVQVVDYAFRGVALSAGEHTVELRYEPRSLMIGIWMTLTTLVLMTLTVLWRGLAWRAERRILKERGRDGFERGALNRPLRCLAGVSERNALKCPCRQRHPCKRVRCIEMIALEATPEAEDLGLIK